MSKPVTFRLTLLGRPSLSLVEGRSRTPELGAKTLALLTYLVLEPGPHSRDELAGLLWGESPDCAARGSLRQAVKQLRDQLGDVIKSDRSALQLAQSLTSDVHDFRRLLVDDPARAVMLDVPRFLAGFTVRSASRYEEWVAEVRRELIREYQSALGTLAREAMGQWRWRDAAAFAERWLSCDPLSDEAMSLAIEARYLGGERGAALARFAEYRAELMAETGCEPSRALLSLLRRVEADAAPAARRPVTDEWYARAPSFESSLVGRDQEWATLTQAWKTARRGSGQVILIEGGAGVGKSRLAEEFVRRVVTEGGTALRAQGYDGRTGAPLQPVVELLRHALVAPGLAGTDPEWLAEVDRLLPELRQRFPGLPYAGTQGDAADEWRLFEGAAQLVLAVAAERPAAILLDDLQWLDEDSCRLLGFLIRRTAQAPVLWLGALNPGELEHNAPAAQLIRALRGRAHAAILPVGTLSEEELWSMIREMGHVSAPSGGRRFASRLFAVTSGNPFYAIELLKTMFARGLLSVRADGGSWTVPETARQGPREFTISADVQEAIAERVERLPEPLREVLITLAIAGSPCGTEVLSGVHGIPRLHTAALADALVDRRLAVHEDGRYRCIHPIIGRVVRDRLTAARRQEIHRLLAVTLASLIPAANPTQLSGEVARHADMAGETALAFRFALMAQQAALDRCAHREAFSWLDMAQRHADNAEKLQEVKRVTALSLKSAGLSEPPTLERVGGPITKGLVRADFDLTPDGLDLPVEPG